MESNGGIPGTGTIPGMLGLEMPSHQQQPLQQHRHVQQHHQMPLFPQQQQQQQAGRHPYATIQRPTPAMVTAATTVTTTRQHLSSYSDEEEAASGCGTEDCSGDGKQRAGSPWQRMKWTDEMVRLLIMIVFLVGDDSGSVDASSSDVKKKHPSCSSSSGGAAGAIQKKGKWKSVSRAMLEKGFRVSPQQCEDKFNDLNKRYKRVVDIVGKGTSCRVVQNPSLLETMDHISPKLKEEVRKLLNSKHLFFKEMCAYHSSITHQPCDADQPPSLPKDCLNQPPFPMDANLVAAPSTDENHHVEDEDDDLNDEDDDEDEGDSGEENELGGDDDMQGFRKRLRMMVDDSEAAGVPSLSPIRRQLRTEMVSVLQDGGKSVWEQRQWVRSRSMLLEEQKVSYQCRALELEKQRFKWQKHSRKKEREFEGLKLENERLRLENDRMILVLRQKEMEIDGMIKRSEPSTITG